MLPDAVPDLEDNREHGDRCRCDQGKIFRARAELSKQEAEFPMMPLMCYVAEPLDHLWSYIQWADGQGNVLGKLVGGNLGDDVF